MHYKLSIILVLIILTHNTYGGFLDDVVKKARISAINASALAKQQQLNEINRKKLAEEADKKAKAALTIELKRKEEEERIRVDNLIKAEQLKIEAQNLVEKNTNLQLQLKQNSFQMKELEQQLIAEKKQLELEKDAFNKESEVLKNQGLILERDKKALKERVFLYSLGFWTSLGAIIFGVITVLLKLPTLKLEREKLGIEIKVLEQKLENHNT